MSSDAAIARPTVAVRLRQLLLGAATIAAMVVLARLGGFDAAAAGAILARSEGTAMMALLPFGLLLLVDATAWALALGVRPAPTMLGRLVGGRLAIEAVSLTVPGSILVSDGIAPVVFARSASVEVSTALAGVAIKKWGIILGHVIVLAIAAAVGGAFFSRVEASARLGFAPRTTLIVASIVGLVGSAWLFSLLSRGAAERLRRTMGRIPLGWTRRLTARAVDSAATTDVRARLFFEGPFQRRLSLVAVSTFVWIAESFEVYVLFRILGATPPFAQVLAMEALLTVVRSLAVFSPGGLGAQEFAYLGLVPALLGGPSPEVASGFVVLRRLRDVVTIALGYLVLAGRFLRR